MTADATLLDGAEHRLVGLDVDVDVVVLELAEFLAVSDRRAVCRSSR